MKNLKTENCVVYKVQVIGKVNTEACTLPCSEDILLSFSGAEEHCRICYFECLLAICIGGKVSKQLKQEINSHSFPSFAVTARTKKPSSYISKNNRGRDERVAGIHCLTKRETSVPCH